jgi:hypothetical protein
MLTDLSHNYEIACLEQAYLIDLSKTHELERVERSLQTASEKLQELINQIISSKY